MDYTHSVVVLTENKDVLDRLRRMTLLHMDKQRDKEYYTAQFDGKFINFYVGEPRTFPEEVGKGLENSSHTFLDHPCPHCKGQGSTVAGICLNCKGRKLIKSDEMYRILKVIRTYDAMLVDPEALKSLPVTVPDSPVEAKVATVAPVVAKDKGTPKDAPRVI